MINDLEIINKAFYILNNNLGIVETERFFSLIHQDNFDYTEWRKNLWPDKTVRELSNEAMDYWNKVNS